MSKFTWDINDLRAVSSTASDTSRTVMTRERLRHFRALRVYKKKTFTHSEMTAAGYGWADVQIHDTDEVREWARATLTNKTYSTARFGTRYYFAYPEDLILFKLRWE